MSTHFRPRPQTTPTPSSPVRPSTAHSTIRAVTPSPPGSANDAFKPSVALPRPKSEHVLGSPEMATYARYVLQAENGGFGETPGSALKRSAAKSRSQSPKKRARPMSTPPGLSSYAARKDDVQVQEQEEGNEDGEEEDAPDTPTPMTRAQKRQAYTPLRIAPASPPPATSPAAELSFLPPGQTALSPVPGPHTTPMTRKPLASNRISVSGASNITALSTASKNSIFSTPGRDEMERKKALVEIDEGPFARVQSMMDLDVERRRVSGKEERPEEEKSRKGVFVGCGCVVM